MPPRGRQHLEEPLKFPRVRRLDDLYKDEIIAEVWRNRDAYAKAHHNDLDKLVADLRRRQQAHPERVVNRRAGQLAERGVMAR